jgi:molecular chaperone DnaK (HSP70)
VTHQLRENLYIGPTLKSKRLVIAIDYGTTFSAVAYALDPDYGFQHDKIDLNLVALDVVSDYPLGSGGLTFNKEVPTISTYEKGSRAQYHWGNSVIQSLRDRNKKTTAQTPIIELIKLLLSNAEIVRPKQPALQETLDYHGVSLVKAIGDYLRELWNYSLLRIVESEGSAVQSYQQDLVLSVPPDWSAEAVRTMQKAAEHAGLPEPEIVAEQEAAALMMLVDRRLHKREDLQVCLSGGGLESVETWCLILHLDW